MQDLETIKEFVIESNENLARLDQDIVELEKDPENAELIASIFRTVHTIKGTSGFLGFSTLGRVSHVGENILSQVRAGERSFSTELTNHILAAVDAIREILTYIEVNGHESEETYDELVTRLEKVADEGNDSSADFRAESSQSPAEVSASPDDRTVSGGSARLVVKPVETTRTRDVLVLFDDDDGEQTTEPLPQESSSADSEQTDATGKRELVIEADQIPAASRPDNSGSSKAVALGESTIRVGVNLLDNLMNLVGELVLARNQVLQFNSRIEDGVFNATSQRLNLITTELQESIMKTRMQPIGIVWNSLPRVVRDLAVGCGKQIQVTMDGANTELDRTIIEAIKDPLTHIVRNSCDHGIERPEVRVKSGKPATGRLSLRAFHEGGHVNIEISDDGGGVDPERVKAKAVQNGLVTLEQATRMNDREAVGMIFLPGFSTAEKVSNISGRGVGMDVVKTNIERIGGQVDISTIKGQGTTVKIKIPLTLAIIPGLVITAGTERFVIPQVSLLELVRLEGENGAKQIERLHNTRVYRRRGNLLPLSFLDEVLGVQAPARNEVINVIVLQAEDREFGLVVETINDTQEIVVKPLSKQLKGLNVYSGATIMGDGKVALILDVLGIAQRSGVMLDANRDGLRGPDDKGSGRAAERDKQSILLFRTAHFDRLAVPLALVARLEEIPRTQIESAGGRMVVQYRDQILTLVPLAFHLDPGSDDTSLSAPTVQVIVFNKDGRLIGLVVDQILDIVEEHLAIRKASNKQGLLGSAVINNKVTDFVDLHAVIEASGEDWFGAISSPPRETTVLIAEPSAFTRGVIRNSLEMAGYRVAEAATVTEAKDKLANMNVHVVAASTSLAQLARYMRHDPCTMNIPVLGLADGPGELQTVADGFEDVQSTFDRDGMLRSLEKLTRMVEPQVNELEAVRQ